jgi:chromate transporter
VQGWLSAGQMIDGLGLAETTPGPLILVTEFVGYLAGHADGGIPLGIAAAIVTLWMTFVPCFLWIFTGAPYIARLSGMPRLKGALSGVTASVVGVILNLTLWFALHVIFADVGRVTLGPIHLWLPDPASFNPLAAGLTALAAGLLLGLKMGLGRVLILSALAGMALSLIV